MCEWGELPWKSAMESSRNDQRRWEAWTREVVGADKRLDVAEKTRFLSYIPSVHWQPFPCALTKWKILSLFHFASRKESILYIYIYKIEYFLEIILNRLTEWLTNKWDLSLFFFIIDVLTFHVKHILLMLKYTCVYLESGYY